MFERLDRALCNPEWTVVLHEAIVQVVSRIGFFDHHPLILFPYGKPSNMYNQPFRFENVWMSHPDFPNFIRRKLKKNVTFPNSLNELTDDLKDWNHTIFGVIK